MRFSAFFIPDTISSQVKYVFVFLRNINLILIRVKQKGIFLAKLKPC